MTELAPCAPPGYVLIKRLGRGASSVVWEARQCLDDLPVAVKLLDADIADPDLLRRFERERDAMAALATQRGILTIFDAGVERGKPWLSMQLCQRGSLATYIGSGGPLDVTCGLRVTALVADALGAAHARGIVHCDVKPANIMIADDGEPVVGDFGIARVSVGRAATTTVGGFSLDHIAPELLEDGERSPRSDIYSLGTTTWELLVGHPPFRQSADVTVGAVLTRILRQPLPESPRIPADLLTLLRAMTAKSPGDRPASMADVNQELSELAQRHQIRLDQPAFALMSPTEQRVRDVFSDVDLSAAAPATHHRADVAAATHVRSATPTSSGGARPTSPKRTGRLPLLVGLAAVLVLTGGVAIGISQWSATPPNSPAPVAQGLPMQAAADSSVTSPIPEVPTPIAAIQVAADERPLAAPAPAPGPRRAAPPVNLPPTAPTLPPLTTTTTTTPPTTSTQQATTSPRLPPTFKSGDFDRNGIVGCGNLRKVRSQVTQPPGPGSTDVNRDGVVDQADVNIVYGQFDDPEESRDSC